MEIPDRCDIKEPMLHVRDPWLSLIREGKKTVEGRKGPVSKYCSRWWNEWISCASSELINIFVIHLSLNGLRK